jgi:hypothetical protein
VRGHRRETKEPFEIKTARVFLAGGVIPTTGILLRSMGHEGKTVFIKDSQYFTLPALLTKRVARVRHESLHALSQIFVELFDPAVSKRTVHLQLYTYNELIGRAVRNGLGPFKKPLEFLAREFENRMVLFQGFIHSDESSRIGITLNGDKLDITPEINSVARTVVNRVVRRLMKQSLRLGVVPLPMLMQFALPGRSFHAGGSFPMRNKPVGFETDLLGRPGGWQRIHAVDATVLPSVAATTITLTAMANAHRIGTESATLND